MTEMANEIKETNVIRECHNFEIAARILVQKNDSRLWPIRVYFLPLPLLVNIGKQA